MLRQKYGHNYITIVGSDDPLVFDIIHVDDFVEPGQKAVVWANGGDDEVYGGAGDDALYGGAFGKRVPLVDQPVEGLHDLEQTDGLSVAHLFADGDERGIVR